MARAVTPEPVLVNGIGMDAENCGHLFGVEGTPLGRIAEQLRKLVEGHVDCVHHGSPTRHDPGGRRGERPSYRRTRYVNPSKMRWDSPNLTRIAVLHASRSAISDTMRPVVTIAVLVLPGAMYGVYGSAT